MPINQSVCGGRVSTSYPGFLVKSFDTTDNHGHPEHKVNFLNLTYLSMYLMCSTSQSANTIHYTLLSVSKQINKNGLIQLFKVIKFWKIGCLHFHGKSITDHWPTTC